MFMFDVLKDTMFNFHQTQVLAAGLENPSEGGEGMQYRCCIHTRDWKVGVFLDGINIFQDLKSYCQSGRRDDSRPDHTVR